MRNLFRAVTWLAVAMYVAGAAGEWQAADRSQRREAEISQAYRNAMYRQACGELTVFVPDRSMWVVGRQADTVSVGSEL